MARLGNSHILTLLLVSLFGGSASAAVTVSAAPTSNMNCAGGVCAPTAPSANLNTADLQSMLAAGNVKVTTGTIAADIDVADAFAWIGTSRLTLQAQHSISIDADVAVQGRGMVSLLTNHHGSGGRLTFNTGGKIDFLDLRSDMKIDGQSYKLENDLGSLAKQIGLVGDNRGSIVDCYSTAASEAFNTVGFGSAGGDVGVNSGTIATTYATGTATIQEPNTPGGGVVSWDMTNGGITASYWDMDTSNVKNPAQGAVQPQNDPGITGLTDAQLKSGLPAGFDPSVWAQSPSINNGYPYLIANPPQ